MVTSTAVYAEVVVDVASRDIGDRLFTYKVPDYLTADTFVGAQVLVPFGHQELVSGYVVSLKDEPGGEFQAKDIAEVIDREPLFDRNYIDFLYWIAGYYCASLASVIAAAIPSDFSPRLRRVVRLTSSELIDPSITQLIESGDDAARQILTALRAAGRLTLTLRALRQRTRVSPARFFRSLSLLRQAGLIEVTVESATAVAPKLVHSVLWTGQQGSTRRQQEVIAVLRRHGGQMPLKQLLEAAGTTSATIKRMSQLGILCLLQQEQVRDPLANLLPERKHTSNSIPELTADQRKVFAVLSQELAQVLSAQHSSSGDVCPWLLHGVTGSGKTEVYLRLIEQTLSCQRAALFLVPEISLTTQLAQRLTSRFGDRVAVWHSALSPGQRYDTWRRLRAGDVKVLLGARSAVLAAIPDLGLIIIDEEHDASYKQSNPSPRYQARHLALERARRCRAMVVLGSATPDISSYHLCRQSGRVLELPRRVFQQAMPDVHIVDMRQEFAQGNRTIFSTLLTSSLDACLKRGEQAILLINRRGYANHVFCRACGYVVKCRSCSVSMVFHQPLSGRAANGHIIGHLACHHCGRKTTATDICPSCQSPFLRPYGLGTQRVEAELSRLFPQTRLLRLDSDVAARQGAFQEVFSQFSAGRADILIGTQMVAKGLDIPSVTVVGVLAADAAFNLPDYRSIERGFQLLTQVSGRAGRGDRPGTVVLQTYTTDMPALTWARTHDYASFTASELACRRQLEYPPFSQLIRIIVSGADALAVQAECEELAEELTNFLEDQVEPSAIKILGPAPCLIERVRGKFRYHLLVKNLAGEPGRKLLTTFFRHTRLRQGLTLAVDVDAVDVL